MSNHVHMICQKLGQRSARAGITQSKTFFVFVDMMLLRPPMNSPCLDFPKAPPVPVSLHASPPEPFWQGSFEGRWRWCSKDFAAGASGLQTDQSGELREKWSMSQFHQQWD